MAEVERADLVDLCLVCHRETDKAWLLSDPASDAQPAWLPKSIGERGEGRDRDVWTMPKWIARDRGWM